MLLHLNVAAVALTSLFGIVHGASSAGFCRSVNSEISEHGSQSAATAYCSSYLSVSHTTKTVTKTKTTITTDTIDRTVTRTHTPTYTITYEDDVFVTSGVSSVTVYLTKTSLLPNSSYSCVAYSGHATPTKAAAVFDAAKPPFPTKTLSPQQISSSCKCLSIAPATDTVTTVTTTTYTRYVTSTSTYSVRATMDTYASTTQTITQTVPSSTYVTTQTFTTTATVGEDTIFRIQLNASDAINTPNYLAPLFFNEISTYLLTGVPLGYGGRNFDFTLNSACNLKSVNLNSLGFQAGDPDYVRFESDQGGPPNCYINANLSPAPFVCNNPVNGGNLTSANQRSFPGATDEYYFLIAIGNSSNSETGPLATLFAKFESGGPTR